MSYKKSFIFLLAISMSLSACLPKNNDYSAGISSNIRQNANMVEEETETQHILEPEKVAELQIASWGEEVYNENHFSEFGGEVLTIRNVVSYTSLEEAGISVDDLDLIDAPVKATDEDAAILSKEVPDGKEWFGMVFGDRILEADGSIRKGYVLLMVEADIANKKKDEDSKDIYVTISLVDRNDLLLYEDPMLDGYLYQMSYLSSRIVYLKEAMNQEKDSLKVSLAAGESMRIHAYFFVPEDYSEYIGVAASDGQFDGGFFSLREDGQ